MFAPERIVAALSQRKPMKVEHIAVAVGWPKKNVEAALRLLDDAIVRTTHGFVLPNGSPKWGQRWRRLREVLDRKPRSAKELGRLAGLSEDAVRSGIQSLRNDHVAVWYSLEQRGFWTDGSETLPPETVEGPGWRSTRWKREPT